MASLSTEADPMEEMSNVGAGISCGESRFLLEFNIFSVYFCSMFSFKFILLFHLFIVLPFVWDKGMDINCAVSALRALVPVRVNGIRVDNFSFLFFFRDLLFFIAGLALFNEYLLDALLGDAWRCQPLLDALFEPMDRRSSLDCDSCRVTE